MTAPVNTVGFSDRRYFARSWALITRKPGWAGHLLVLLLAGSIPIVGQLGLWGYIAEWGRATAWGISPDPQQSGITLRGYIKSGWRTFVVSLVWATAWAVIVPAFLFIPFFGLMLFPAAMALSPAVGLLGAVAVLRATIYQNYAGGLRPRAVLTMAENDTVGLVRIFLIQLLGGMLISAIGGFVFSMLAHVSIWELFAALTAALRSTMDVFFSVFIATRITRIVRAALVATLVGSIFSSVLSLVVMGALGLWMRQFDVPSWGGNDDPLPAAQVGVQPGISYSQQVYPSDRAPQHNADPGQVPYAYGDTNYGQAGSSQPPTTPR